jgi:hypothetical protein
MAPFCKWFVSGNAAFVLPIKSADYSIDPSSSCLYGTKTSEDLSEIILALGGSPSHLLRLFTTPEGIRGVYLNEDIRKGDILLQMPLTSCLRDDDPPSWLIQEQGNNSNDNYIQIQSWVTRLAAALLETQSKSEELPKATQEWLDLLPESLKESLPVHWSESVLQSSACRPLELAVDSAFFARAGPLADLSASNMSQAQIERALDLVQTRACRCSALTDTSIEDGSSTSNNDLRVLVPIFDFINHSYEPNAEFYREQDSMVVRALRDILVDEEVFIHYGSSTMPVWKCLFSYGFIPSVGDVYEHNVADILVDDYRFEVSPTEIPFELVQYQAQKLGFKDEDVEFSPKIGREIVEQLVDSAKILERKNVEVSSSTISFETLQLVSNLRESHRRTLLACAGGLRDYIQGQEDD